MYIYIYILYYSYSFNNHNYFRNNSTTSTTTTISQIIKNMKTTIIKFILFSYLLTLSLTSQAYSNAVPRIHMGFKLVTDRSLRINPESIANRTASTETMDASLR